MKPFPSWWKFRVYTRPGKTEKPWNLKIGQKVLEICENLKKTWKSHGICHPVKKKKMFELNIEFFRKTACGASPSKSLTICILHILFK
jgi:hypothetical protein